MLKWNVPIPPTFIVISIRVFVSILRKMAFTSIFQFQVDLSSIYKIRTLTRM